MPQKSDIVTIPSRAEKVIDDWQWSSSFVLDGRAPAQTEIYTLRWPTRISIQVCFSGRSTVKLLSFLPKGDSFWTGSICAKPVKVAIAALPTAP